MKRTVLGNLVRDIVLHHRETGHFPDVFPIPHERWNRAHTELKRVLGRRDPPQLVASGALDKKNFLLCGTVVTIKGE